LRHSNTLASADITNRTASAARCGCALLFEEGQLFAEEEILGSQRGARSEA
jgi:hypothetical protein